MHTLAAGGDGIPTSVVITIVVACAAVIITAVLALVTRLGSEIDKLGERVTGLGDKLAEEIRNVDHRVGSEAVGVTGSIQGLTVQVSRLEERIAGVERRT
jgi:predicted PurR-regulated permease PerM